MNAYGYTSRKLWALITFLLFTFSVGCSDCTEKTLFAFNWPIPSTAVVEMQADDGSNVFRTKFTINLAEGIAPDELLVTMSDFKYLQWGDADLDDPAIRAEIEPLEAIAATTPPMVISKEGKFLRFHEWDKMLDSIEGFFEMVPSMDKEIVKNIIQTMKNPATLEKLQTASAKDWNLWVGSWVDVHLCRGDSKQFTYPAANPWAGTIDASAEITYLPKDSSKPEAHRLQFQQVCSGADMREALLASMKKLIPADSLTENRVAEMRASIGACYLSFEATITTDPSTLLLSRVSSSQIVRIGNPKNPEKDVEQVDNREYTFTWK